MFCPFCNKKLVDQHKGFSVCPDGHGTLVTGKYLSVVEESQGINEVSNNVSVASKHQIMCPHCSYEMHKVDFNSTNIIIDSCTNCHYRWLDSGEFTKLKTFKPNNQAKDLLFIANVDDQIREANKLEIKDPNPRLPLQGSYRAGSEALTGLSGENRVRLASIVGQGL